MKNHKLAVLSAVCVASLAFGSIASAATAAQCRTALKLKPNQYVSVSVCPSNSSKNSARIMSDGNNPVSRIVNAKDCSPAAGPC